MEIIQRKRNLHSNILKASAEVSDFYSMSSSKNNIEISEFVSKMGSSVRELRREVDRMLSTQLVLLEAHDIIGAAFPVLMPSEFDKFVAMDNLESLYSQRCTAWQLMNDCNAIRRRLLASKLSKNNNIFGNLFCQVFNQCPIINLN